MHRSSMWSSSTQMRPQKPDGRNERTSRDSLYPSSKIRQSQLGAHQTFELGVGLLVETLSPIPILFILSALDSFTGVGGS